jgi:hypothetical protein
MNAKTICLMAALCLACNSAAFGAGGETYQATGTVLEVTASMIAIQKGTERMEFGIDPQTKLSGSVKAGETITVTYAMSAMKIESTAGSSTSTATESKASASPASSPQ